MGMNGFKGFKAMNREYKTEREEDIRQRSKEDSEGKEVRR